MKRIWLFAGVLSVLCSWTANAAEVKRPNVLFIAVDDLNHWVGHLGRNPQTRTQNIDRLAKSGARLSSLPSSRPAQTPANATSTVSRPSPAPSVARKGDGDSSPARPQRSGRAAQT